MEFLAGFIMGSVASIVGIGLMLPSEAQLIERVMAREASKRHHPTYAPSPERNADGDVVSVRILNGE